VRIVSTAEVPPVAREAFAALGEIEVDGDLNRHLAEAEVLIVRGGRIDETLIEGASRLRAIARTGAGYDNLDVDAATRRRIPIVYAPDVGSRAVAEGTLALILAAMKRLRELGDIVHSAAWSARYEVVGLDLEDACAGIVGLGAIGRQVATLCRAVGMRVIAHDPAASNDDTDGIELVPLSELAARADVITLHCALTRETRGLIDSSLLSRVGPGAVLVNVARGEIVESDDVLAEALASGRLSGIALDVYPTEPPQVEHRLYTDPRVICTPHSVGLTGRWNEQVFRSLAKGVQSVLAGKRPPNLLNPESMT
jgi:D-3-phosphoglycerate dehydrogenase / 2-oxoglutarate reductase